LYLLSVESAGARCMLGARRLQPIRPGADSTALPNEVSLRGLLIGAGEAGEGRGAAE